MLRAHVDCALRKAAVKHGGMLRRVEPKERVAADE